MKIFKSTNETPLADLPKGRAYLTINGEDPENIWVAKDEATGKMYLLNHAINFYPCPSWGSEWPLSDKIDIAEARGETIADSVITLHPEAYNYMQDFIIDDILDLERFNNSGTEEEEEVCSS